MGGSVPDALIIAPNPSSSVESKGNHCSSDNNSLASDIDELIREHPQIRQFVKTKQENDQELQLLKMSIVVIVIVEYCLVTGNLSNTSHFCHV